jgi:Ca2+-binding EF-hand superfamily protein
MLAQAQPRDGGPGGPPRDAGGKRGPAQLPFADAWKAADKDADGFVSRNEFDALPRVQNLPEEKRQALFARLDKDGDGRLGREELNRMGRPQDGKGQQMQQLWELDVDRSGGVSFKEFAAGRFFGKLPPERQRELFSRLDTDGDGQITARDKPERPGNREGTGPRSRRPEGPPPDGPGRAMPPREGGPGPEGMRKNRPAPGTGAPEGPGRERARPGDGRMGPPAGDLRQMIRQLDQNGDDRLSFEEFRKAPSIRDLGEDEQERRFLALDRNQDHKLGPEDSKNPEP